MNALLMVAALLVTEPNLPTIYTPTQCAQFSRNMLNAAIARDMGATEQEVESGALKAMEEYLGKPNSLIQTPADIDRAMLGLHAVFTHADRTPGAIFDHFHAPCLAAYKTGQS